MYPGLFVSGLETAQNKSLLTDKGITHVVNCVTSLLANPHPEEFSYLNFNFAGEFMKMQE